MLLLIILLIAIPVTIFIKWRDNTKKERTLLIKLMDGFLSVCFSILISSLLYTAIVYSLLFILPTHNVLVEEKVVYENNLTKERVREYERTFDSETAQYWFTNKIYQVTIPKIETVK